MEPNKIIDAKEIRVDRFTIDHPIDAQVDIDRDVEYHGGIRQPARSWGGHYLRYSQLKPLRRLSHD